MARTLITGLLLLLALASAPATATATATATDSPGPRGVWPLQPEPSVERGFEPPSADWMAGHRGVDLAGRPGQPVRAALGGRIGFVGSVGGKPVVTVLHGHRRTTYEPVAATLARGDTVLAGDPIGRLVTRSGHCFPATCLHWGLREGDTYLDPLSLVGGDAVRLLPLWRDAPVPATGRPARLHRSAPLLTVWASPLTLLGRLQLRLAGGPVDRPDAADRW